MLLAQALRVKLGQAERTLRNQRAEALDEFADAAADRTQILAPVGAAPDLKPVDDELIAHERAQGAGREQRKVREGAGVDDVVLAAAAQEMQKHARAEHERGEDASPATRRV